MHREWRHEVSQEWLMARRACLTASDIKRLIPDYKRVKAGKIRLSSAQQFAKVYGEKHSLDLDPMSYGPAARGHVLEPHAVDEFNASHKRLTTPYYWWDDRVITNGVLGFSPDALDIEQVPGTRIKYDMASDELVAKSGKYKAPEHILEIKCYEAGAHYQRMAQVSEGIALEERWQVATAMAVCPTICIADIMFYAPQCRAWFSVEYDQHDLHDEIETIEEIKYLWTNFKDDMNAEASYLSMISNKTEQEIYEAYLLDNM